MKQFSTFGVGFLLVTSLAGFCAAASKAEIASRALDKPHLTHISRVRKTAQDAKSSAAYVVAGSSLMTLGLLFGQIRSRPKE